MLGLGITPGPPVFRRLPSQVGGGDTPSPVIQDANLLPYGYLSLENDWNDSSSNVEKTYNQVDQNGNHWATRVYMSGANNHHQWLDLGRKLGVGRNYEIRVWVNPDTAEGFTGDFQLAYYDDTGQLAGEDVPVTPGIGWQELTTRFIAPNIISGVPSLRILGWGNGQQGEAILIGEIKIVDLSPQQTAIDPGVGVDITGSEFTHPLGEVVPFNVLQADRRGGVLLHEAVPSTTNTSEVLYNDFGAVDTDSWDWGSITVMDEADSTPFGERYLRTLMGQGSYSGSSGIRGAGFDTRVVNVDRAFLRYQVRFKPDFDFVKGGKLPGLMGGNSPSGGEDADQGFSARMMWRRDGQGELYLYCMNKNESSGAMCGRGSFYFEPGIWHTVEQEAILNDVGRDNGIIRIWIDGMPRFEQRNIIFRDTDAIKIEGVMDTIFFGGGDATWGAEKDEYIDHGDFVIYSSPTAAESS